MEDMSIAEVKTKEIYEAEQEGDMLTHEVMRNLNKTFLTPMDREIGPDEIRITLSVPVKERQLAVFDTAKPRIGRTIL